MSTNRAEQFHNQTRVIIAGEPYKKKATELLLHILNFTGKDIDAITSVSENIEGEDFILFEAENQAFLQYHPTLALLTDADAQNRDAEFLNTITAGGIVIYDEENITLTAAVENSQNFFRKIPYQKPFFHKSEGKNILETDLGDIPTAIPEENLIFLEGVRLLAQQLGIMEEEFYEAIMEFAF